MEVFGAGDDIFTSSGVSDETFEFLFQVELRAMWREVGAILGYPVGWRG